MQGTSIGPPLRIPVRSAGLRGARIMAMESYDTAGGGDRVVLGDAPPI